MHQSWARESWFLIGVGSRAREVLSQGGLAAPHLMPVEVTQIFDETPGADPSRHEPRTSRWAIW